MPYSSLAPGDQLKLFLEKNPQIPVDLMLVEDYTFGAFNSAGFGKIGENAELAVKGTKKFAPPDLTPGQFFTYLRNVGELAPIPKGLKFAVPEGVVRLGGTFGIDSEKVVYLYEDGIPGDNPTPTEVLTESGFIQKM